MGIALSSDRWWAVIRGINIVQIGITVLVSSQGKADIIYRSI